MTDPMTAAAVRRARQALNLIDARPDPDYSLSRVIHALMDGSWGTTKSRESEIHARLTDQFGATINARAARLPAHALETRDLTVATAGAAGFLAGTRLGPYTNAFMARSVALALGAQTYAADPGSVLFPVGNAATTTQWLTDEAVPITEAQPSFKQTASVPKTLSALTEISMKLLKQSNAEEILRTELNRAGAAALDAAVLSGSGLAGEPLGVSHVIGVSTFAGGALNRAGLIGAMKDMALANGIGTSTGFVTDPATAALLAARADSVFTTQPVWVGNLHDGQLIGERAMSTTGITTSSMIYGDWANCVVVSWGTPELSLDNYSKFKQGIVAVRLLMLVDVVVTNVAAFSFADVVT